MSYQLTPAQARVKWAEALRSGKYQQSRSSLCRLDDDGNPAGYCCLGVACEVMIAEEPAANIVVGDRDSVYGPPQVKMRTFNGNSDFPPIAVCEWLGLRTNTGEFFVQDDAIPRPMCYAVPLDSEPAPTLHCCLANLNDHSDNFTFDQIADLIEKAPAGLFKEEACSSSA